MHLLSFEVIDSRLDNFLAYEPKEWHLACVLAARKLPTDLGVSRSQNEQIVKFRCVKLDELLGAARPLCSTRNLLRLLLLVCLVISCARICIA